MSSPNKLFNQKAAFFIVLFIVALIPIIIIYFLFDNNNAEVGNEGIKLGGPIAGYVAFVFILFKYGKPYLEPMFIDTGTGSQSHQNEQLDSSSQNNLQSLNHENDEVKTVVMQKKTSSVISLSQTTQNKISQLTERVSKSSDSLNTLQKKRLESLLTNWENLIDVISRLQNELLHSSDEPKSISLEHEIQKKESLLERFSNDIDLLEKSLKD